MLPAAYSNYEDIALRSNINTHQATLTRSSAPGTTLGRLNKVVDLFCYFKSGKAIPADCTTF